MPRFKTKSIRKNFLITIDYHFTIINNHLKNRDKIIDYQIIQVINLE